MSIYMLIIYGAMTLRMMKLRIMTFSATKTKLYHSLFTVTTCYSVFSRALVHQPIDEKSPVLLVVVVQSEYEYIHVNNIWRHDIQHDETQDNDTLCHKNKISHSLFTVTTCYSALVHQPIDEKSTVLLVVVVQSEYEYLHVNNIWRHDIQHDETQDNDTLCHKNKNISFPFYRHYMLLGIPMGIGAQTHSWKISCLVSSGGAE